MKLLVLQILSLLSICGFYVVESHQNFIQGGFKYYISTPEKVNWYIAWETCAANGMHLIDIQTYLEEDRLNKVMLKSEEKYDSISRCYWTGGTNQGHDTDMFYFITTGEPVVWANWLDEFPLHEVDSCLSICLDSNNSTFWKSDSCILAENYICRGTIDNFFGVEDLSRLALSRRKLLQGYSR